MSQSPARRDRRLCKRQGHVWKTVPTPTVEGAMGSAIWVCARCGIPKESE